MAQAATAKRPRKPAKAAPAWVHGMFHWNELMTRDAEAAKKFYKSTIGWSFEAMPTPDGGTYWLAHVEGREGPVAGMFSIADAQYKACRNAGCRISPSTTSTSASPRRSRPAPS